MKATLYPLEHRLMLAALPVSGTSVSDIIRIRVESEAIVVELNGVSTSNPIATFTGIDVSGGSGNDSVFLDRIGTLPTTVNTGSGSDAVHIGHLGKTLNGIGAPVTLVAGAGGSYSVSAYDDERPEADHYAVSSSQFSRTGIGPVALGSAATSISLFMGNGNDRVTVSSTAVAQSLNLYGQGGNDILMIDGSANKVLAYGGDGEDEITVNTDAVGVASAAIIAPDGLDRIETGPGGTVEIGALVRLSSNTSVLDGSMVLAGGGIIETASRDFAGRDYYRARILNGIAGTQPSIIMSAGSPGGNRVGLGYGSETASSPWGGFVVENDDLVVRSTLGGDADLNGRVDFTDLLTLAQNYSLTQATYTQGDFTLNGAIDFDDLLVLAQNYGAAFPELAVTAKSFLANAAPHGISFQFNFDIGNSLTANDLVLTNLTTGEVINSSLLDAAWNSTTRTATFTAARVTNGIAPGALPEGRYRATLPGGSVSSPVFGALPTPQSLDFVYLAADFDNNAVVDFDDLLTLSQRYGLTTGATRSGGDTNYDGRIDFTDLLNLAQRYGQAATSTFTSTLSRLHGFELASSPSSIWLQDSGRTWSCRVTTLTAWPNRIEYLHDLHRERAETFKS